jgi:hypothetical protein
MEFRWIVVIALWTLLIGPIVGVPTGSESRSSGQTVKVKEAKPRPLQAPRR